ncbi:putative protein isoform X3 [Capsicum galapagoense]
MHPLAPSAPPPGFMSSHWTDDEIILSLDQINRGSPIPDDVIVDNPYLYDPSNLQDGAWFFVRRAEEKETKHGLWRAKGAACEIFANSAISGWRTTFEFSQIQAPIEEKTVWMIQEYKITLKGQHDQTKSQESTLCRVFSCCNETKPEQRDDLDTLDFLSLMSVFELHTSSSDGQRSIGEPQVNSQAEGVVSSLIDKSGDHSDDDCILRGDYLELNDLVDAASHSSSSESSSRPSFASDEYFDSMALLRDLDDDEKKEDLNGNGSNGSYNTMTCVLQPAPLESLVKGGEAAAEETQQAPAINKSEPPSETSTDQAAKRLKAERMDEGPSHSCRPTTSSSSSSSSSSSDEAGRVATRAEKRTKKLMKYFLCFIPF